MISSELITNQIWSYEAPVVNDGWNLLSPEDLTLEKNEAQIWLAPLDEQNTDELWQIVSAEERARAGRFRFERDKRRFIAARGVLRILLGKYLRISPQQIRFEFGKYGKPSIAGNWRFLIKFNVSHSENLALFAFTLNREIGIDLERSNSSFIDEGTVSHCFTPSETTKFKALSEKQRQSFFFESWTRKEAYLKALGIGLSQPANQVEISALLQASKNFPETDSAVARLWSFYSIPPIADYAAALVIEGNSLQKLRFWKCSGL
jgi:4'-phosphopantetheinyl transferase